MMDKFLNKYTVQIGFMIIFITIISYYITRLDKEHFKRVYFSDNLMETKCISRICIDNYCTEEYIIPKNINIQYLKDKSARQSSVYEIIITNSGKNCKSE